MLRQYINKEMVAIVIILLISAFAIGAVDHLVQEHWFFGGLLGFCLTIFIIAGVCLIAEIAVGKGKNP